jgi:hypothetical protein
MSYLFNFFLKTRDTFQVIVILKICVSERT